MVNLSRRKFVAAAPMALGGMALLSACGAGGEPEDYDALVAQTWRAPALNDATGAELSAELVQYATLAPSSHNTQCWKFALEGSSIAISPDLSRRCPAVDPDDHHLYVSLGCATENLAQAALARGLQAETTFDESRGLVHVALQPTTPFASPLFRAITERQCTRGDYDGAALRSDELDLLQRAGSSSSVQLHLITDRAAMERVLEYVVQANTSQMADPAFVRELKQWIRFNGAEAARERDGLYSAASGNPNIPSWLGKAAFDWVFTPKGENEKYARQVRNSAGLAVFVGQSAGPASWVEVGRAYERFALQATALGVRNAMLNQPVEVQTVRPQFASMLGLGALRPDLVVRFGRGALMPRSLRRPVSVEMA